MNLKYRPAPSLEEVFAPEGIAVVGASGSGRLGFAEMVVIGLLEAGYQKIYPVNPKYEEIMGLRCYPRIGEIPGSVDHVVVNIPADSALSLLDECAAKGVHSVHFFTAGFGESGNHERIDLEAVMLEKAKAGGFRLIGPNCVGLFVPKRKVTFTFDVPYDPGPIGFLSQSGGHACNLPLFSATRGLRFSKIVSYGNGTDVNELELLSYFAGDPETKIIAAYVEGVTDGREFSRVLRDAAARKPVVIYKGGKTVAGLRAAKGHTASMINSVAVFEAVCQQANSIQVESMEEMIDVITALRWLNVYPRGKNVALFGSGVGPSVLAGDEMENAGLTMPSFCEKTRDQLREVLPIDGSIFTNPLDTPNLVDPKAIKAALEVLGRATEVDMLVYHMGFHPIGIWGTGRFADETYLIQVVDAMRDARDRFGKPILLAFRPPQEMKGMEEFLVVQKAFVAEEFPVFYSLGQLALALNRVIDWHNRRLVI